jgi:hypothetical protein
MAVTLVFMLMITFMCALLALLSTRERFNVPELIYKVDLDNTMLNVFVTNTELPTKLLDVFRDLRNVALTKDYTSAQAYVTDAFTMINDNPVQQGIAILPEKKYLVIVKPQDKFNDESLLNFLQRGGQVLGASDNAVRLVKSILLATKNESKVVIDMDRVTFKTMSSNDSLDLEAPNMDLGCYALFDSHDNLKRRLPVGSKISILTTEDYDIHKLKVIIPYARFEVIDTKSVFGTHVDDEFPLKSVMTFDMVLCTTYYDRFNYERYAYQIGQLLEHVNTFDSMNYYTQYIDFVKPSVKFLKNFNAYISKRGDLQILEQYNDPVHPVQVKPTKNVTGFFDASKKRFTLLGFVLDNVELRVGYVVILSAQDREEENGEYVVETVDKHSLETHLRLRSVAPPPPKEDPQFDPRYVCYGDPYVVNPELCNSKFDEIGNTKVKRTYWDRPCKQNTECPFYQANTNYKNYRGGCVDGYCELPLGVNRLSFRKYDAEARPLCHRCKQNAPYCCELQKNRNLYPHLSSPDYAFELDEYDRRL